MIGRRTALLKSHPRQDWGGTYADSATWASWFKKYKPYDFGVMGAQTFASQLGSHMVNKPLLWLTQGQGNTFELPGGHNTYAWRLNTDTHTRMTIMDVDANLGTQPGKSKGEFVFYGDRGWYHEPAVLKTEDINSPMIKLVGFPTEVSPGIFRYVGKVQDGNESAYVNPAYLQIGKTLIDASTQVSDELNYKRAGIEFGSQYNLSGNIGYVARKIEVTDKFIRLEKGCSERGESMSRSYRFANNDYSSAVGTGYIVARRDKNGRPVHNEVMPGAVITTAEALLEERIAMDKEMGMTFGRVEISSDSDTGRQIMTGAGWLQIARDGNFREHNGNLTLESFTEMISSLYYNTVDPSKRKIYIRTGEEGIKFASRLIAAEAGISPFVFDSSYFIEPTKSTYTDKALRWGAQFTEFRGFNGVMLVFVHDPTKDNPYFYPDLHPVTGKPKESGSYDVMDLGETDAAPAAARTKSNVAMITEPEAEEYYMKSAVYDIYNGSIKDGSSVQVDDKECGIYRTSSYKLEVWDVSRTLRLQAV